jgi:hypothetical protein
MCGAFEISKVKMQMLSTHILFYSRKKDKLPNNPAIYLWQKARIEEKNTYGGHGRPKHTPGNRTLIKTAGPVACSELANYPYYLKIAQ